jgi:c-di-GMP-binding flagellar brake protein YcgR
MPDREHIWTRTVSELAERNESIELRPVPAADGHEMPAVRLRLLAVESTGTLLVERPLMGASEQGLRKGAAVTILMVVEGQRWEATSVIRSALPYRLNDQQTVRAWRLAAPRNIQSAQRRAFFRADTGGVDIDPVILVPLLTEGEEGPPLQARLVNIGGGGMGVTIPLCPELLRRLKASRHYECRILLPRIGAGPLDVTAELVHLRRIASDLAYLGLTFRTDHAMNRRFIEDTIVRFTTWLQREQIRRERRGA